VLLSGSANATTAALGQNQNVEVCIARIQRNRSKGWTFVRSDPPELRVAAKDTDDDSNVPGVLRAVLEGERIKGRILTPKMIGIVRISHITSRGAEELGKATLGQDASFDLKAPGLELQSWQGGRLVIQARSVEGQRAEGFVSVSSFAEITRRAGAVGPRLLAILAGTETPEDVAAIMSWFHEDPRRLAEALPAKIRTGEEKEGRGDEDGQTIEISRLSSQFAVPLPSTAQLDAEAAAGTSWRRFMDHVFAAFRERRGPFGRTTAGRAGDDEDNDLNGASDTNSIDPAVTKSLEVFEDLFDLMLSPDNTPRHAITAFDLTQYVCERLNPDATIAKIWLERLMDTVALASPPVDRLEEFAAATLVLPACASELNEIRTTRSRLLRLGYSLSNKPPSAEHVRGFQSVLIPLHDFAEIWARVQAVRTYAEQTTAYIVALNSGKPSTDYSDLSNAVPEEWPVLRDAIMAHNKAGRVLVLKQWSTACPLHHRTLPGIEISKLRNVGVATARNCCDRVLVYSGS
jgi:hypothetical protein